MINIPADVFEFHILKFLDYQDILKFTSCNKFLRTFLKFLKLNRIYSLKYYHKKLKIPENLKVHNLDLGSCKGITDVSALGAVHDLNLSFCDNITDVSALGAVHTLNLTFCNGITDVSALGGVHTLNLSCLTK